MVGKGGVGNDSSNSNRDSRDLRRYTFNRFATLWIMQAIKLAIRLLGLTAVLLLLNTTVMAQTNRVLLVGDSWAEQQWDDQSHAAVLLANGFDQYAVVGGATTISGSTAADWTAPAMLQLIEDALVANPSIDTVQLTIGGNDFLDEWRADFTPQQTLALQQQINADVQVIIDFILLQDPNIETILSFYDYPNFVDTLSGIPAIFCFPLWSSMAQPTPFELNTAATQFENFYANAASTNSRVQHVSHFGFMQFNFGFPDEGIQPGDIPLPGDLNRPSPIEAMRLGLDCFHLEPEGYDILIQNLFEQYLMNRLDTVLKASFEG